MADRTDIVKTGDQNLTLGEFLELEDCDRCPLKREEICPGGFHSDGRGNPFEPPCCSWNYPDDTDMEDIAEEYLNRRRHYEAWLDKKDTEERKKKERAKKSAETRKACRWYCWEEQDEVKRIEKQIRAIQAQEHFASSFAQAMNITNEMFRYEERVKPNPVFAEALSQIEPQLAVAKERYSAKRKEFYAQRKETR